MLFDKGDSSMIITYSLARHVHVNPCEMHSEWHRCHIHLKGSAFNRAIDFHRLCLFGNQSSLLSSNYERTAEQWGSADSIRYWYSALRKNTNKSTWSIMHRMVKHKSHDFIAFMRSLFHEHIGSCCALSARRLVHRGLQRLPTFILASEPASAVIHLTIQSNLHLQTLIANTALAPSIP